MAKASSRTILIVDDDPAALELLGDILRAEGYEVAVAANGEQALHLLRKSARPRLIILDLIMPIMDGWEFRRRQKLDKELTSIPVVIVTAIKNTASLDGAVVLTKPINVDALLATVAK